MPDPAAPRKRVLLLTRNLPPLLGGMERLNQQMAIALSKDADLTVVGPAGCGSSLPTCVEVHEIPIVPLRSFVIRSLLLAHRLASRPFDLVVAGSGLMAPAAVVAAKRAGAKSVVYVHGLDIVAAHPLYRALWLPALRRIDGALANSENTARLAAKVGVAHGNVVVVHPGTAIPSIRHTVRVGFRSRFGLGSGPLVLSVGRLTRRKGLVEFVRHVLPVVAAQYPDVRLLLVGDDAPHALNKEVEDLPGTLADVAAELGVSTHLVRLGPCDDATLEDAYGTASVHVFPVKDVRGDVEGFGMVAIEAAAHGLPTVAFATGGVPDAVGEGVSGHLLAPGDYAGFASMVCDLIETEPNLLLRESSRSFALNYSWEHFELKVRDYVSGIIQDKE